MKKRVAVIGAGSSGLVCLKELLTEGHAVVGFEAQSEMGGVFRSSRHGGCSYDSMSLTSSNYVTAFSDFAPAEQAPGHWQFEQYLAYLRAYAERFDLLRHVRFGTRVERIEQRGGEWHITTTGPDGQSVVDAFDAVAVCSGVVQAPNVPQWDGLEGFRGEVVHSADYRNAAPFAGKRVVVVGSGETAVDLVNEISRITESCHVSLRDGQWVIPRVLRGAPNDFHTSRVLHGLPRPLLNSLSQLRARVQLTAARLPISRRWVSPATALRARLLHEAGGGCFSQFAVKSEAMLAPLLEGRATRHGPVERLLPDGVVFRGGEKVEADVLLLCTGYRQSFRFMADLPIDFGRLYRRCFSPEHGASLAFIGFARPAIGAIPPIAEMQSRWFALLCSGRRRLPSPDAMRIAGAEEQAARRAQFGRLADRLQALVDYTPYQDALADEIGCRPDLLRVARTDPRLAWKLFAGPFIGAQFRLVGPHADPAGAQATLDRVQPALTRTFMAFLIAWHVIARLFAALGFEGWRPPLRLGEPERPTTASSVSTAPTPSLGRPAEHARNG